jgi:predicted lysophospholipase L1 biosynthesis ABC-type transport system permease subunit
MLFRRSLGRLRALAQRETVEREMQREMQDHIDRATDRLAARGLSAGAARAQAVREFGNVGVIQEEARDALGVRRIEEIARDLRFAIRSLKSRPAFTLTVIATLALGIGANAAIFTLVDALLLRPLPVSHPEQLVIVGDPAQVNTNAAGAPLTDYVSFLLYRDVRARNTVFNDMYATGWAGSPEVKVARAPTRRPSSHRRDS